MERVKSKVKNRNYFGQIMVPPQSTRGDYYYPPPPTMLHDVSHLHGEVGAIPLPHRFSDGGDEYIYYAITNMGRLYWRHQGVNYRPESAYNDVIAYVTSTGEIILSTGRTGAPELLRMRGDWLTLIHVMGEEREIQ